MLIKLCLSNYHIYKVLVIIGIYYDSTQGGNTENIN